ncbi:gp30.3 [Aeromonas phage 31]|uniref:Uncharacterized protein n=4 Tax=Biquartavirus TaxID=1912143 RepID=Q6U9I5_9CAUD|nr:hypothetical protein ST44RRORF117c [Aeromonas phage 44RR2.8t]YP_238844.1 hypothetical protein PHG31p115 [Aeromonas phage 31]APU00589.1 hypothetical protein [Aeromonas phage 44RR2.8t.2]APU01009.1 hypothetical protein [Aeromonas phage 31.2]APU02171.1 hypothetical protein [Aeromonas phage Riv-10]APU02418.1 hypothetical protein [Aeromonas phage SW69-9]UYD59669.1 hypothetical protein JNMOADIG_00141 [Aeromonas phage avDM5]UYD60357.1 hypothetical protein NPHMPGLK_00021 [Aeromonas phage avDM2]
MDIGSGASWPSCALSNFAPHEFYIDGVRCASIEGFLQSLKFKSPEMQEHVCSLVGKAAKFKGKKKNWWRDQTLYWRGKPMHRQSDAYSELISRAYDEVSKNSGFKRAILATRNSSLTHSMGKNKKNETVLTEQEFCSNLYRVRDSLQAG